MKTINKEQLVSFRERALYFFKIKYNAIPHRISIMEDGEIMATWINQGYDNDEELAFIDEILNADFDELIIEQKEKEEKIRKEHQERAIRLEKERKLEQEKQEKAEYMRLKKKFEST